ncbi:phenylalanine--tRNA ligase subunit alpha [bacterium endosymbiont of Pedicinus badii]|uniref:phenylalanine--tRNA ligase subunit alpha n=1 Tax=bacterium endosymbiont of Pedicinus badii TaxID=1719126 RepID=UPI0009BACF87|nr:phenylalanine--tRNA ligase subunit alpha [bacterium endosymbiont of Pedicinus badii]OQM34387.1 hypothetical protein AOQ89_00660 [bacterium endosymbiont of Pedicinus badii]
MKKKKEKNYHFFKKYEKDFSLPGKKNTIGSIHIINQTIQKSVFILKKFGFFLESGKEIEDSYHNFTALNVPENHPSRDEKDTFWISKNKLLRTQTSGVQIRILKKKKIPTKVISFGKVYRKDYDKTHTPMFHQIEGFYVDKNVNFLYLKNILINFIKEFFEKKIQFRFRCSYFPFTEPSFEIDISKDDRWIEVLGCGMIHPKVLKNVGIDCNKYSGFAFGIGIERLASIKYEVEDIRLFFENDVRFLKQF